MAREAQATPLGKGEGLGELLGRVGRLGTVHAQPDELVDSVGENILDHLTRHLRVVLAVYVRDEPAANAKILLGRVYPLDKPVHDRRHRDATASVQGRIEEHLPVLEVAEVDPILKGLLGTAGEVFLVDDRRGDHGEDD